MAKKKASADEVVGQVTGDESQPDKEALIREKVQAGLSRKQALQVIEAQEEYDAENNAGTNA